MIAIIILLRVLTSNVLVAETSYQMLEVLSFCDGEGEGITSFNKDNSANSPGEKNLSRVSMF